MNPLYSLTIAYLGAGLVNVFVWPMRAHLFEELRKTFDVREAPPQGNAIDFARKVAFALTLILLGLFLWPVIVLLLVVDWLKTRSSARAAPAHPGLRVEVESRAGYEFQIDWALQDIYSWDPNVQIFYHRQYQGDPEDLSPSGWTLVFPPRFKRDLRGIDRSLRERVSTALKSILDDPSLVVGDTKRPLEGNFSGLWRYRISDHRIVYRVDKASREVILLACASRSNVYARFDA